MIRIRMPTRLVCQIERKEKDEKDRGDRDDPPKMLSDSDLHQ